MGEAWDVSLDADAVAAIAREHDAAESGRTQMRARSQFHPEMTLEDAYRIQSAWVALKQKRGRKVTGRKVGLTSRAMQQAMKIDEPDFGTLLDDMAIQTGDTVEADRFRDPRLEVELAFVLKAPVAGPDVTLDQVMTATDHILPSMELIAARSHRVDPQNGYTRTVLDTISDNAANAGYILGKARISPTSDLRWTGALLYRNEVLEETGLAAGVLGHPGNGLVWLARRLSPYGIGLEPGQVYLSGSFTRPVPVQAGDIFRADFGPYGTVDVSFR